MGHTLLAIVNAVKKFFKFLFVRKKDCCK